MPYRVDVPGTAGGALERLVDLGALDVEHLPGAGLAALMPDTVTREQLALAIGGAAFSISPAVARDDGSVWILQPRPIDVAGVRLLPAENPRAPGAIRLVDGGAFGTGLHATTALCLEALRDALDAVAVERVLDVGTGSGILALAALTRGVPRALGIDVEREALNVAARNAQLNDLETRLDLALGGPEVVNGTWPLVLANVLAAPLIEMAPALVRRVGRHGRLVLSGIPEGVTPDVERAYQRLGMMRVGVTRRAGWAALALQASW